MGETSRLYQELFYKTSLATEVSGGLYVPSDPGMLYVQAEFDQVDKSLPVCEALFRQLARIKEEGPTDAELERVLVNAESERLYAMQTADGMAGRLGFARFVLGDVNFDQEYLERLRAVTTAKIQDVARRYLDINRLTVAFLLPKDGGAASKLPTEEILTKAHSILGVSVEQKTGRPAKAGKKSRGGKAHAFSTLTPEITRRPSGLRVIYRESPQSHVFSIHAVALGGLRGELFQPVDSAEKDWGASHMMALTWTKGTSRRTAHEISSYVEGHAANMDGFAGRNTVGLQMTGLARDWKGLSDLFAETLVEPSFPDSEVQHSKRVAEDEIKGIDDHTAQLCSKLFLETLFERHPYGKLTLGSLESIGSMSSEKLLTFHRRWIRPETLVVTVTGTVGRKAVQEWVDALEQRLLQHRHSELPLPNLASIPSEQALVAPRWAEKHLGREQIHIMVGSLGTTITSEDRHVLRLLHTLLSGQSGRLFVELREKKSLAYTVAPVNFEGMERGYVGTYIACSPQKKDEAIQGIRTVLEKLAAKGPTDAEMKRAKEFYLGRRAMDLQSDSAIAAHYGLEAVYGLPPLTDADIAAIVEGITAKQIREVCRKYYLDLPMVTCVVG